MQNARGIVEKLFKMSVGDPYDLVVKRGNREITISGKLLQRKTKHIFEEMENPTDKQLQFRAVWMKNLDS